RNIVRIEVEDLAKFAETLETICGFAVAVAVFEAITVNDDVFPAGESVGGLARVHSQGFFDQLLTRPHEVEEIHFHHIGLPRLHPYRCNGLSRRRLSIQQSNETNSETHESYRTERGCSASSLP